MPQGNIADISAKVVKAVDSPTQVQCITLCDFRGKAIETLVIEFTVDEEHHIPFCLSERYYMPLGWIYETNGISYFFTATFEENVQIPPKIRVFLIENMKSTALKQRLRRAVEGA